MTEQFKLCFIETVLYVPIVQATEMQNHMYYKLVFAFYIIKQIYNIIPIAKTSESLK